MSRSGSEAIAKALKGGGLSSVEKIKKAREAWNNNSLFFPNKDDFLFTWLCSSFAKPNMKKLDDCCLFQIDYWILFVDLLEHYQQSQDRNLPPVHINPLASVIVVLQHIDNITKDYLSLISRYLQLFFSVSFTSSYRPTFEHVSALVEQILISLETQTNEALLAIALPALQKLNSQLVAIANQKKVFSTLVDKLLSRLLSVRRRIDDLKIKEQITDIICKGLFHSDIILEYTSVLSSVDTTAKQTTYVIRLFDLLESMVKQDRNQMLDAVDIMPTLLSAFVISFRQKRNMRSEMMQSNDKKVEIGMFMYMLKIYSNMEQDEPSVYLKSLSQLLEKVVHEGLYTAQIEQDNLLLELSSKMIGYIHSSTGNDQSSIFDILDHLLQIDMSLLESQLNVIWPIMLNPDDQAESSCTRFATSVLKVYTASRQMDVFLNELLEHICRLQLSDLNMLKKPLFKSDFLDLFSRSTSNNYMPIEQILGIFNHFSQKLNQQTQSPNVNFISIYFCRFISSLKPSTQQRQRFQEPSLELFKTFIKPSLTRMNTFIPAIQAHSVLTRVFCENYTQKLESADLASIESSITSTFEQSKEGNNSEACMRTALCCNALLQHIYYHTLLFKSSSQRLDLVLDFIFDESDAWYIHATWDGSILNIHSKVQAKLVCWKLLTDDWFEPLSRCLDKDQAKTFMHIIYQTMKHEHSTRAITASMLSKKMLRCASFYEANCFSSWNVQTYLKAITSLFNTTNQPDTASTAAAKLLSNIDTTAPFTWDKSVIHDLFPHLHVSSTTEPMEIDDMDQQLVTIFNLLALFPNECFGKNEHFASVQKNDFTIYKLL
ncbi:hypothetical protein RMCBS344292_16229 [Rhizopus microsporus]|nr:hypothetical protein RMCBS344292_16229 [Rhizopus microsporus]